MAIEKKYEAVRSQLLNTDYIFRVREKKSLKVSDAISDYLNRREVAESVANYKDLIDYVYDEKRKRGLNSMQKHAYRQISEFHAYSLMLSIEKKNKVIIEGLKKEFGYDQADCVVMQDHLKTVLNALARCLKKHLPTDERMSALLTFINEYQSFEFPSDAAQFASRGAFRAIFGRDLLSPLRAYAGNEFSTFLNIFCLLAGASAVTLATLAIYSVSSPLWVAAASAGGACLLIAGMNHLYSTHINPVSGLFNSLTTMRNYLEVDIENKLKRHTLTDTSSTTFSRRSSTSSEEAPLLPGPATIPQNGS